MFATIQFSEVHPRMITTYSSAALSVPHSSRVAACRTEVRWIWAELDFSANGYQCVTEGSGLRRSRFPRRVFRKSQGSRYAVPDLHPLRSQWPCGQLRQEDLVGRYLRVTSPIAADKVVSHPKVVQDSILRQNGT